MTNDFDLEIRNRLAGLAAAVPVDAGSRLRASIAPVVRPGSTSRRFAVGALAPLVVLVLATVVASLSHVGPFAPAATGNGPATSTVRDGPFELTIKSAKSSYAPGEAVDVTASLAYRGPQGSVAIAHGQGSPMAFGVIERVGGLFLTPAWRQSCEQSVLERDVPLVRPFAKSGSFSGDNPAASDAAGFFEDPTLELPLGTWHLYVVADFGVGDCGVDRHLLRADLEIKVLTESQIDTAASPSSMPVAPQPTLANGPSASPDATSPSRTVTASVETGTLQLGISANLATVLAGQPITIGTTHEYLGPLDQTAVGAFYPVPTFTIVQLDAVAATDIGAVIVNAACRDWTMTRRVATTGSLGFVTLISGDGVDRDWQASHISGGELRLPAGTWRITASFNAYFAPECAGRLATVVAAIDINVVAPSGSAIELWTATQPSTLCALARDSGRLALDPRSGLGVAEPNGEIHSVKWRFGYSARHEPGGAVLIAPTGEVVAREGDLISFAGGAMEDGSFFACTEIGVDTP